MTICHMDYARSLATQLLAPGLSVSTRAALNKLVAKRIERDPSFEANIHQQMAELEAMQRMQAEAWAHIVAEGRHLPLPDAGGKRRREQQ